MMRDAQRVPARNVNAVMTAADGRAGHFRISDSDFDRAGHRPGENPPVGLILCAHKGASLARYALEGLPNKVLAAEYKTTLPNERRLADELAKTQAWLERRT